MTKNTGIKFENEVYETVKKLVESNDFLISNPNVKIYKKKPYYSKDRDSNIICDVTVEKYMGNPDEEKELLFRIEELLGGCYGEELGIACEDPATGRLTCVLTRMFMDQTEWKGTVNIRYPVTADGKEICRNLEKIFTGHGFEIAAIGDNPGYILDPFHPAIDLLTRIACEGLGLTLEAYTAKGGTYGRKIPAPAVGYGPNCPGPHPFGPGKGTGHLPDEAVSISGLKQAAGIFAEALVALDTLLYKKEEER